MPTVFFLAGGLLASFAARVPAIQDRFELSEGGLGIAFMCLEAGAVLGLPLGAMLCARIGSRAALRLGFVVYPCGLAGIAWAPFAALAVCAIGTSIVDVAMNVQGLELERRAGRRLLSRLHAAHSAGVVAGGLSGTLASAIGIPVTVHLAAVAIAGATAGQLAARSAPDTARRPEASALPRRMPLALATLAFCGFLIDGAANNWSAVQVSGTGGGETLGAAAFTVFASALAVGRMAGERFMPARACGLVAAGGVLVALLAPNAWIALAGWAIAGLGLATVAPRVVRAAGPSPASIAAVTTVGYLGSFTGPALIGGLAHLAGLDVALLTVAVAGLAVSGLARRMA
jgi:hypothetical protein